MRILVLIYIVLFFCLATTCVAEVPNDSTRPVFSDYDSFVGQFSEKCQPLIQEFAGSIGAAALLFDKHRYTEAQTMFDQRVEGMINVVMNAEECTIKDARIMMMVSDSIRPLESNIACMVQFQESAEYYKQAVSALASHNAQRSLTNLMAAKDVLDDMVKTDICVNISNDIKERINLTRQGLAQSIPQVNELIQK